MPEYNDYNKFFIHLRKIGGKGGVPLSAKTLWCEYSKINFLCQATYKFKLQHRYPDISLMIKGFEREDTNSTVKEERIFTIEEINTYITESNDDLNHYQIATAIALTIKTGCRSEDTIMIDAKNFMFDLKGCWLVLDDLSKRIKNNSSKSKTYFIDNDDEWLPVIKRYLSIYNALFGTEGRIFRKIVNGKLSKNVLGKRSLQDFTKKAANYLRLQDSDNYT